MTTTSTQARVGDPAPDSTADTDAGERLTLASRCGRAVVLYFYPKDDTSGCTAEAREFRDAFPRFGTADATVLGASPDPVASHAKFKAGHAAAVAEAAVAAVSG